MCEISDSINQLREYFEQRDSKIQQKIDFVEEIDLYTLEENRKLKAELDDTKLLIMAIAKGDASLDYNEEANTLNIQVIEGVDLKLSTNK